MGRLVRSTVNTIGGDYVGMVEQGFDVRNNVNRLTTEFGGLTHTQQYFYETNTLNANSARYSKDNLPSAYKFSSNRYATYDYDSLNRLNKRTFTLNGRNLYNNYVYWLSDRNAEGSNLYRTTQLKTELIDNTAYTYTYDKVGNITEVKKGTRTNANTDNTASGSYSAYRSYVYDDLGQLTRENNATAGETHVFTYDSRGNIGSNTTYAYTTASSVANPVSQIDYVYGTDSDAGWKKLVTSVDHYVWNDKGEKKLKKSEAMDYDEIGNPIVYRGADLLWNGRQLRKYKADNFAETYFYNADGLRVRTKHYIKSGSSYEQTGETRYEYVGSSLAYQVTTNVNGAVEQELYFFYDASGNLSVIRQVTPTKDYHFYVTTNAQGDVLGIYSSTGTLLASYEYDAWGNCTIVTDNPTYNIGATNPIRYRGYYYDSKTELYYLQSRYYDSEIGRFINCDDQISGVGGDVQGYNLYSYCYNNPVNLDDSTGHWPQWIKNVVRKSVEKVRSFVSTAREKISKIDLTYSKGVSASGTFGIWGFDGQIGISADTKGNVAIQYTVGANATTGSPGGSITQYGSVTNASSIYELEGSGYQAGESVGVNIYGVPVAAGYDALVIPKSSDSAFPYIGATGSIGVGTPGTEYHVGWGKTYTIDGTQFNVFEIFDVLCEEILECV